MSNYMTILLDLLFAPEKPMSKQQYDDWLEHEDLVHSLRQQAMKLEDHNEYGNNGRAHLYRLSNGSEIERYTK